MSNRTAHPIVEPDELSSMFEALDDLRESGEMNMFGAPRWLLENFDLTREEAQYTFDQWTKTYG